MSKFRTVRGMRDFLPKQAGKMRYVEELSRELAQLYGYGEVITPVVESYELLAAKSGEEIRQRMYAFEDLGGRKVALRPEFTASIARLVATKMRNEPKPMRLFCLGSLYRYDEPQYARFREFWQANYELIGSEKPEADAEILALTNDLMGKLSLRSYHFKIGHMGILRGILRQERVEDESQNVIMQLLDKKRWEQALGAAKDCDVSERGIETLKEVFKTKGSEPGRVLRRVKKVVQEYESAVAAVENLSDILGLVRDGGVEFEMLIEAGFARGLEYYTGLIFEPYIPQLETALGGGGRYDKLIQLFGGEPTPAVGVAQGIDRLVLALKKQRISPRVQGEKRVFIIPITEGQRAKAMELSLMLRRAKISAEVEVMGRTVSKALEDADRKEATHSILVGPEELRDGKVVLRDMKRREQKVVAIENLCEEILAGRTC
ncbi:MAG: histidine--tRNA ligase [Candidatus Bathyarchaeia archaeon]